MSEHYIKLCHNCGTVVSQCRCSSLLTIKTVRWGVCAECFPKKRLHTSRCWSIPATGSTSKPVRLCTHGGREVLSL